jgi:hypothetical protein
MLPCFVFFRLILAEQDLFSENSCMLKTGWRIRKTTKLASAGIKKAFNLSGFRCRLESKISEKLPHFWLYISFVTKRSLYRVRVTEIEEDEVNCQFRTKISWNYEQKSKDS